MTPKKQRKKAVAATSRYDAPYWQKAPAWKTVAHIIECGMQFVPNGRQVPIHVEGKLEIGWTITNAELRAFAKAADTTAKRVVKELGRRRRKSK